MPDPRRSVRRVSLALEKLDKLKLEYGPGSAARKLAALKPLLSVRFPRPGQLLRLHEILVFLRAYPDDARILSRVERALAGFERRRDLALHRRALVDTGVAGTDIHYRFFWFTALWLVHRWPERLSLDWDDFEAGDRLESILGLLLPYC
jgi:hypothetical protein